MNTATLDPLAALATKINRLHAKGADPVKIGKLLRDVKWLIKHGEWVKWYVANLTFKGSVVEKYLRSAGPPVKTDKSTPRTSSGTASPDSTLQETTLADRLDVPAINRARIDRQREGAWFYDGSTSVTSRFCRREFYGANRDTSP
jgi:hypothetical protein